MLSGPGSAGGIHALQGRQEPGQVECETDGVGYTLRARRLAVEPLVDRPRVWVAGAGLTFRQRGGDGQRQLRGERRKPALFLVDRQGVLGCAGQTRQHSVAEVEGPVVPPAVGHGMNRQVSPLRELVEDKPAHLFRIDSNALRHGTEIRCAAQCGILTWHRTFKGETLSDSTPVPSAGERRGPAPAAAEPSARVAIPAPEHACRYDHKTPATLVRQRLMPRPGPVLVPGMRRMSGMGVGRTRLRTETM